MGRQARAEVFSPDEVAIVHVMNRVVRRCFLMGDDPLTGKNYDHRKLWMESELERLAAGFAIDLLTFTILDNHFHLALRSRPDVVNSWDDTEVARRWLMICPKRKHRDGTPKEPSEKELNSIRKDPDKLREIRTRLSDISWWMRLLCQRVAQQANAEEEETPGKFWQNRFKAVRLLDEAALLACAAYVDLNPIRAAMAETIEESQHTSAQRRAQALVSGPAPDDEAHTEIERGQAGASSAPTSTRPDQMLAPVEIDEQLDPLGPRVCRGGWRCSDKGFLPMSTEAYLELLDWTARQMVPGKRGHTPQDAPPILERLKIDPKTWCQLVDDFGELFSLVAGLPQAVDSHRGSQRGQRFHMRKAARELLSA